MSPTYWGKDKQVFLNIALLELVSNDYPETCFNTGIPQNGNDTKLLCHSCLHEKSCTPSCAHWQLQSMEIMLNDSTNVSLEPCEICLDWWVNVEHGNKWFTIFLVAIGRSPEMVTKFIWSYVRFKLKNDTKHYLL